MKLITRMAVSLAFLAAVKVVMNGDNIIRNVRSKCAMKKQAQKLQVYQAVKKMDGDELKQAILHNDGKIVVDEKKEYKITVK